MQTFRLILQRHAKSSWDTPELADHLRPLAQRGQKDAPRMGQWLVQRGWLPHVALASDSVRTRQTLDAMTPFFAPPVEVQWRRDLYHADVDATRHAVHSVPRYVGTLMVVGHNPGHEQVAEFLTGAPVRITTANAVLLERRMHGWHEAFVPGSWRLVEVLRPRPLRVGTVGE